MMQAIARAAMGCRAALMLIMVSVMFFAIPANGAPLPPFRPIDLCGEIRSAKWLLSLTLPLVKDMSGSAGRMRTWPSRFVIVLRNVRGPSPEIIRQINAFLTTSRDGHDIVLAADELLIVLPHDDPERFAAAAELCVTGFVVKGDEGGTWTLYESLETKPVKRGQGW